MKILFLVPYPTQGASNRIRVEQFIPYLKDKGISCKVRPFVNKPFFRILYQPGHIIRKTLWFVVCTFNRIYDIFRAFGYDLIFIHREAYPFGGPFLESALYRLGKPIVFDFDDAIFLPNTSEHNSYIERFKRPDKVSMIINMSRHVIAGNKYLGDFAAQFNKNVTVIPSSINTGKYTASPDRAGSGSIVIGWIGSNTTKPFLYELINVFEKLEAKYKNLEFKVVGAEFQNNRLKNVINKKWALESELDDIRGMDIGIMPMPDNIWTKGKCGFKAILYMSCSVPVVASPVGTNLEIVDDGVNGFYARTDEEWLKAISKLIEDYAMRRNMGENGRKKVIEKYSVASAAPLFYESLITAYGNEPYKNKTKRKYICQRQL